MAEHVTPKHDVEVSSGTALVLLVVYGLATQGRPEMYARSLDVNVNLWWGLVMAVFGGLMLYFSRRKPGSAPDPGADRPDPDRPSRH